MNLPWRRECPNSAKKKRFLDILAMIYPEIVQIVKENIQNQRKKRLFWILISKNAHFLLEFGYFRWMEDMGGREAKHIDTGVETCLNNAL